MRGKAKPDHSKQIQARITPAYAGKSEFPPAFTNVSRDHPRLCGEKIQEEADRQGITGSPPPMRGKVPI